MQTTRPYSIDDINIINGFLEHTFNKSIKKSRIYIHRQEEAPQGAKISRGKNGGLYYESEERQRFTEEVSGIEQKVKATMKFSDDEERSADILISNYTLVAKNEFKRILSLGAGKVSYRVKNKYSILEKMRRKGYKSFDELGDIFGIRIEVNRVDDIYATVKKLEQIYGARIIEKEDAIANPKGVYRSYHLNIKYANGIYGEIQIRTPLMDRIANASHVLLYKNHIDIDQKVKENIEQTLKTYSEIAINNARTTDLKMIPKTKELLRGFGL